MAGSTSTNSRASKTPARGSSARGTSRPAARSASKTAPTKKLPRNVPTGPNVFVRMWMGLAHVTGGAARALGPETLGKEERRDGLPFFLVLLAIAGAVVEWFFINDDLARQFDAWTFGGLFGRLAFALPVIMLCFAVWLFRHPASVHDNTRIGIGLGLLLLTIAGLSHLWGGQPQPAEGMPVLAQAGGILGWMLAAPLIALITVWGAGAVLIVLGVLSILIITKTPPNRIGERLGELYRWLFGAPEREAAAPAAEAATKSKRRGKSEPAPLDGFDDLDDEAAPAILPWWRRNASKREEDPDFAHAETADLDAVLGAGSAVGGFDTALEGAKRPTAADDYGTEVLADLERAERAVGAFTGDATAVAGAAAPAGA
ncbi:DNA translocase FtsK 4TM domain-containing protein, partial [Agromyces seonyuensis]